MPRIMGKWHWVIEYQDREIGLRNEQANLIPFGLCKLRAKTMPKIKRKRQAGQEYG